MSSWTLVTIELAVPTDEEPSLDDTHADVDDLQYALDRQLGVHFEPDVRARSGLRCTRKRAHLGLPGFRHDDALRVIREACYDVHSPESIDGGQAAIVETEDTGNTQDCWLYELGRFDDPENILRVADPTGEKQVTEYLRDEHDIDHRFHLVH